MVAMKALKGFTNTRITKGPRDGGQVLPGEDFETDWLHAKELQYLGLAEARNPDDLKDEPTALVEPHNQLSVSELAKINDRRKVAAEKSAKDADKVK